MDGSAGDLVRAFSTLMLTFGLGTVLWLTVTIGYARLSARRGNAAAPPTVAAPRPVA